MNLTRIVNTSLEKENKTVENLACQIGHSSKSCVKGLIHSIQKRKDIPTKYKKFLELEANKRLYRLNSNNHNHIYNNNSNVYFNGYY